MILLVIGDSCEDFFVYGECSRLCPDAPVPVFTPTQTNFNPGMAGNVLRNLEALGCQGHIIAQQAEIIKKRIVHNRTNHTFIRIDSNEEIDPLDRNNIPKDIHRYDAVIISDYDKGFLSREDIKFICSLHPLTFVDTKKHISKSFLENAKFIKINEQEYNLSKRPETDLSSEWPKLEEQLIVTLGSKGCRYKNIIYPVDNVEVKDMTGAGDTFLAALVFKFLQTKSIEESIPFANICATQVVQKKGVSVINPLELKI